MDTGFDQQMFTEVNKISQQNMVELNPIQLQNNFEDEICNGNSVQHDMEMEHSELSEPSSSPSRNSESPFAAMPDTPDVDVDNENTHQLSSMSSDCMDPASSPLCNEGDTLSPQEGHLDNMDRSEFIIS